MQRQIFEELEKFYRSIKWDNLLKDMDVHTKYETILDKYNEGCLK